MPSGSVVRDTTEANDHVRTTCEAVKKRYGGFVPGIYKAFANDSIYLESINRHIEEVIAFVVGVPEILSATSSWNEINRFNIGARVTWPGDRRPFLPARVRGGRVHAEA